MASGIWKLNWGWPAANPPSTDCGFQPSLQLRDHPGADVAAFGRGHVAEASYVVGCDAVLHLCGAPATGDDRRAHPDPNAPWRLRCAVIGVSQAPRSVSSQSMTGPSGR